jgi:hypothetical protein
MTQHKGQMSKKTPPIVFVIILGTIVIIMVLALSLSGGQSQPISQDITRKSPDVVNDRVVTAMQNDDPQALFNEINPSMQAMFPLDSLQKAKQESEVSMGKIVKVEVIQHLTRLNGPEWNNQWAEARVRIIREKSANDYIVRYYQENGSWWLAGTIER